MVDGPRMSLRRIGANSSAKIGALITHLKRLRKEDFKLKSVVFSQFTSFLDLIEPALERYVNQTSVVYEILIEQRDNIAYLRFDGSMSQKARAAVLNEFRSRTKGVVLLLSLRA